jgi:alpha-glucosidase
MDSVLNSYRHFNHWRKDQPTLRYGDINFIDTAEPLLAFVRQYQGEQLLVCFNFSEQSQTIALSSLTQASDSLTVLSDHKLVSGIITDGRLQLPPFGCFYSKL